MRDEKWNSNSTRGDEDEHATFAATAAITGAFVDAGDFAQHYLSLFIDALDLSWLVDLNFWAAMNMRIKPTMTIRKLMFLMLSKTICSTLRMVSVMI